MGMVPVILSVLAVAVLGFGRPQARRCRRPGRFRAGVIATALGLVCLWLLPASVALTVGDSDVELLLLIGALIISGSLLGGGLEAIRRANNTPGDDSWDTWWDDCRAPGTARPWRSTGKRLRQGKGIAEMRTAGVFKGGTSCAEHVFRDHRLSSLPSPSVWEP